ncbi:hypothetical protein FHX82_005086 [Amycolatopsis bartoniae]|uniref:DUF6292 domain-containing protein n=1 Tax=Amycolatopsis bartoniae TaxID=941986 RepID=A0A8H9IWL9_9PSEU|nr:DUF6292 family protein [Amycolatopsis bartoniae]MBB2938010.1 hypothetical protein [Amycolatopsis bartoniae]TVT07580.1 hypothetical protein FNH07_15540 [Amycolatopsis bartoniae]GHF42303.1 hypothetical protein GCM10017566_14870 [Amycolatopsis bartoniae]
MKPEPESGRRQELRHYVETVARLLGVEPAACWSEAAAPSTAYIALADRPARHPGRFLMLQWSSDRGWCLAVEPERDEPPEVLAAWPVPPRPRPEWLAGQVRVVLEHQTERNPPCMR